MAADPDTADVSVCVPVYRAHEEPDLGTLAASLPAAFGSLRGELVVALNGISADAVGAPTGAITAELPVNRGVAPGWNAAARAASGDVLCFANDDLVIGPGAIELLVRVLRERPEAGVVGPEGTPWDIPAGTHGTPFDLSGRPAGDLEPCEVVSGFFFACRRETYDAVGGFDEYYAPFSWEEVDFCTAVRDRGLRCYAVAGVEHEHDYGVSQPQPPWRRARWDGRSQSVWWIHRRNRRHFLRKWATNAPAG
jgi:GT2 family glycosyltransferase